MSGVPFTVDAKLLMELGERLVGRPHIALAELIKNSYDADARRVEITFGPDRIEIVDDGHGMSRADFVSRWMRVGTVYKQRHRHSPELKRAYTGSKGVGRLAAQLLAREMSIETVALKDPATRGIRGRRNAPPAKLEREVSTAINWDDAIKQDQLTQVTVDVRTKPATARFAAGSRCGTRIVLRRLTSKWDSARFRRLAQEIWALQPPFQVGADSDESFEVTLDSPYRSVVKEFDTQMRALLDIWTGKVTAELLPAKARASTSFTLEGDVDRDEEEEEEDQALEPPDAVDEGRYPERLLQVTVQLVNQEPRKFTVRVPHCRLNQLTYELRIFDLNNRQPRNVKVGVARSYLRRFGGVNVFDAGFRLPYYGSDMDWLRIERDHARRLSQSRLLPEAMRVTNALQDLPTNRRIFGGAYVSTSVETERAIEAGWPREEALSIQVTRDRLVENASYAQLRNLVRLGMDMYAVEMARFKTRRAARRRREAAPTKKFKEALGIVQGAREYLPAEAFSTLTDTINEAIRDTEALEEAQVAYLALLGALATAGMTSLAYDHEISKQMQEIDRVGKKLRRIARTVPGEAAESLAAEASRLAQWAAKAEQLRRLFSPLSDEETRETVARFPARQFVEDLSEDLRVLSRGAKIDSSDISPDLILPLGAYPAWSALLQNILINAFNATLDAEDRSIHIDGARSGREGWLRVQDTGVGVDVHDSERLFEPFVRALPADRRRAMLGLGGSGLGLTIVRMIADEIGVGVHFEEPEPAYSTAVAIRWTEPRA